jgi:hypothetical protein
MNRKLSFAAACAAAIIASLGTATAHARTTWNAEYSGRPYVNYSGYQDSHGNYASPADLTRSVEGTPCGVECTKQHEQHWG